MVMQLIRSIEVKRTENFLLCAVIIKVLRTVPIAILISVRSQIIFPIRPIIRATPTLQRYVRQDPVIPIIAIPHIVDVNGGKEVIRFAFLFISLSEIVQVSKLVPSPDMARIVLLGMFR